MQDTNPLKSLYTLRDIITGLIQPWHASSAQQVAIDKLKFKLNSIIEQYIVKDIYDIKTIELIFDETSMLLVTWKQEINNLQSLYDRLDRTEMLVRALKNNMIAMISIT